MLKRKELVLCIGMACVLASSHGEVQARPREETLGQVLKSHGLELGGLDVRHMTEGSWTQPASTGPISCPVGTWVHVELVSTRKPMEKTKVRKLLDALRAHSSSAFGLAYPILSFSANISIEENYHRGRVPIKRHYASAYLRLQDFDLTKDEWTFGGEWIAAHLMKVGASRSTREPIK